MERLWGRTKHTKAGCMEFQGAKDRYGYGAIKYQGKKVKAHRLSFILVNGDIPEGLFVCHSCDNPPCINPEHLWLGTAAENNKDKIDKGRHRLSPKTKGKV